MSYIVRCQTASGRTADVRIVSTSESAATRAALRELSHREPGQGWRAVWVLPS